MLQQFFHNNVSKSFKSISSKEWVILLICLVVAATTRLYNLEHTGIFYWDQAYDLNRIHQFYINHIVSLVGPISENNIKVFGSLTYYMLLPFAFLGHFDVASTTYGMALWGLVTTVLIWFLTFKVNKKFLLPVAILTSIWFPLIETSRMAWNPHFITFWVVLGLIFYQYKKPWCLFIAGLCLGLTIHHHYLAIFATGIFILLSLLQAYFSNSLKSHLLLLAGYVFAISPFILFDLTHPPGLFLTRLLYFSPTYVVDTSSPLFIKLWQNFYSVVYYYTHTWWLALALIFTTGGLALYDHKKNLWNLIYLAAWMIQIFAILIIKDSFQHYFLPGLVFFLIYSVLPRKQWGGKLAWTTLGILILGSLITIIPQITTTRYITPDLLPDIATSRKITDILEHSIKNDSLTKVNIAVLGSSDPNTYGWRYRSLLSVRGVEILSKEEYFNDDYLFVISQSPIEKVRQDSPAEVINFANGKVKNSWKIADSNWNVYLLEH